jgi:hypothetical protein
MKESTPDEADYDILVESDLELNGTLTDYFKSAMDDLKKI